MTRFYSLNIANAVEEDSGNYVCLVINSLMAMDRTSRYQEASLVVRAEKVDFMHHEMNESSIGSLDIVAIILGILVVLFLIALAAICWLNCHESTPGKHLGLIGSSTLNTTADFCSTTNSSTDAGSFQRVALIKKTGADNNDRDDTIKKESLVLVRGINEAKRNSNPRDNRGYSNNLQEILIRPRVYQVPGRPILQENYAMKEADRSKRAHEFGNHGSSLNYNSVDRDIAGCTTRLILDTNNNSHSGTRRHPRKRSSNHQNPGGSLHNNSSSLMHKPERYLYAFKEDHQGRDSSCVTRRTVRPEPKKAFLANTQPLRRSISSPDSFMMSPPAPPPSVLEQSDNTCAS